jgi:O-antigen/teichoic acid export membrane protein
MSDEPATESHETDMAPLTNRFSRATLLGCLGIACVMALPVLLFLPLDDWHVPGWLALLVPLAAFGAVALGAVLMARVPPASLPRARSPLRPLTGAGMPPLVERPATLANRFGAAALVVLALAGLAAVLIIAGGAFHHQGLPVALVSMGIVGGGLIGYGLALARGYLPPPAWRWVRTPIRGVSRSAMPLVLAGLAALAWTLLVAADAGYRWGWVGLGLLVVAGVLAAPLARRAPRDDR